MQSLSLEHDGHALQAESPPGNGAPSHRSLRTCLSDMADTGARLSKAQLDAGHALPLGVELSDLVPKSIFRPRVVIMAKAPSHVGQVSRLPGASTRHAARSIMESHTKGLRPLLTCGTHQARPDSRSPEPATVNESSSSMPNGCLQGPRCRGTACRDSISGHKQMGTSKCVAGVSRAFDGSLPELLQLSLNPLLCPSSTEVFRPLFRRSNTALLYFAWSLLQPSIFAHPCWGSTVVCTVS